MPPESVTVEHGGVEITTNTMSEADLRTEMEAPATPDAQGTPAPPAEAETPAQAAERARDEKGRFAAKAAGEPQQAATDRTEPQAEPEAPARRRDDSLPRHNPIARMQQALARQAEAERRAQALEAELLRITQASPQQAPTPTHAQSNGNEPQFEQFANEADPYTSYLQAWTRWDRAQAIAAARDEWEAAQTQKSRAQTFQSRLNADKVQYPDFDQVLTQADTLGLQVSAVMQEAIADSPKAADLVYYLATHPEECLQLAEESVQTPVTAAPVMRRLLESHLAPRAVPPTGGPAQPHRAALSTAKPPVTPVGSSPVVSDEPPGETASAGDHARYWNRKLRVPGTK